MMQLNIKTYSAESKNMVAEFANSVDPDEAAQIEPPHPGPHCLPVIL